LRPVSVLFKSTAIMVSSIISNRRPAYERRIG